MYYRLDDTHAVWTISHFDFDARDECVGASERSGVNLKMHILNVEFNSKKHLQKRTFDNVPIGRIIVRPTCRMHTRSPYEEGLVQNDQKTCMAVCRGCTLPTAY